MKFHHTKSKGDLGVLKAQLDLYEKGYFVCVPLTEHSSFDLVIVKDEERKTVQVKSKHLKNGKLEVSFRQSFSDKNGVHTKFWNKSEIDIVCVYCLDTDKCYYFNPNHFNRSINLRVEMPKNNQAKNIHFADDFLRVP
jgi:PD-(D/E)XK endonuclease